MDLDTVAAGLYQLAPAEFVAARDARVAEARADGDETLAAAIKKLRRPTAGAALINALAHEREADLAKLFEIGDNLREAQARGAGDELRQAMKARQQALRDVAAAAGEVAKTRGTTVSATVAREIQETLLAAASNPDAQAAVLAGRLTGGISVGGTEAAGPAASGASESGRVARPKRDDIALRRAWREAREVAMEARRDADRAGRDLADAEATASQIGDELRALQEDVKRLTEAKAAADRAVATARKARTSAERSASAAATRSDRTEAAAKDLPAQ
jgi:hypothetical protein